MQKKLPYFKLKSQITSLVKLDNNLFYYSTVTDGIKIFSAPKLKTIKNIQIDNFDYISGIISISKDAKFLAYSNKNILKIISIESNSIINTIELDANITAISFDVTHTYLFVATSSSKIDQFRYNNSVKLATINRFYNHKYNLINILFSNFTKVLSADEYGLVMIVDIYTNRSQRLNIKSKLSAVCFIDEENVIIGDYKGYLSFISIEKNKITKRLLTPFEYISQIINTPNKDYILINSGTYYITLVDIKLKKVSILKYLVFEYKIISIAISDDGLLYIVLENNDIISVNIYDTHKLSCLIEKNNINKAYNLIESNPLLENTVEYDFLEQRYKLAYKEATLRLIYGDKTAIIKINSIYRDVISKQKEIEELDKAFKEYKHLKDLFLERKYAICYALIDKFPPLKATPEYKKLEERYKSLLLVAQHHMSINKQDLAREALKDYIIIHSKRPIIKPLLENNTEYLAHQEMNKVKAKLDNNTLIFHQAYNHSDFKRCYEILDENPSLNDLELAKLLNKHYQNIIFKCDKYALDGDIKSVKKELGDLFKISTRKTKTGNLLRVSFLAKIKKLMDEKLFRESENMIYSYMDIFGIEKDLSTLMQKFEKVTDISLAISEEHQRKKDKNSWYYDKYFNS